jgi:hypothetical protein
MPHVGGRHSRLCNDLTAVVESVLMAVRDAALALRPPEQLPDHHWPLATRVDPDTGVSNARAALSSDPTASGGPQKAMSAFSTSSLMALRFLRGFLEEIVKDRHEILATLFPKNDPDGMWTEMLFVDVAHGLVEFPVDG